MNLEKAKTNGAFPSHCAKRSTATFANQGGHPWHEWLHRQVPNCGWDTHLERAKYCHPKTTNSLIVPTLGRKTKTKNRPPNQSVKASNAI
jgi:hypothetical protein